MKFLTSNTGYNLKPDRIHRTTSFSAVAILYIFSIWNDRDHKDDGGVRTYDMDNDFS